MADKVVDEHAVELLPFLDTNAREDLKFLALDYMVGLTGSEDGKLFLRNHGEFVNRITKLTRDRNQMIRTDALSAVVNLSAEPPIADIILESENLEALVEYTLDPTSQDADKSACILSNLTRTEKGSRKFINDTSCSTKCHLYKVVEAFCKTDHNPKATLHYLAALLSNLTQLKEARDLLMDKKRCVIQQLLPFIKYEDSVTRRGGVLATLKNCCFDTEHHEWMLSDDVDVLPHLLLPLAGGEVFDEDVMEKLPPDLQYLDENKQREQDPDIRTILVETLTQLSATQHGRKIMRENKVYAILDELYNWEQDEGVKKVCLNLIELLIADEPEQGMENLREVQVPDDFKVPDEH